MRIWRRDETGAGSLLPIADLYRDGLAVRTDGTLVKVAALTSLNPWVLSPEDGERVLDAIGRGLAQLPAGTHVMFLAEAHPIRLHEVIGRTRELAREAVRHAARSAQEAVTMARLYGLLEEGLVQHASEDATIHHEYFLVMTLKPAGLGVLRRPLRERAHRDAVRELERRMERLRHTLMTQGIRSTMLDGPALAKALWAQANPTSADRAGLHHTAAEAIASTTSAADRTADEAVARARDVQARLCLASWEEERNRRRWLRVEDDVHVTLLMTSAPQAVSYGWMASVLSLGHPFRFAVHMRVRSRARESRRLSRERNMLHTATNHKASRGMPVSAVEQAHLEEVAEITGRMAAGEQLGFLDVSVYQTIRVRHANDGEDIRRALDVAKDVRDEIAAQTQAGVTLGEGEQLPGWQATTLLGVDPVGYRHAFTSDTAAAMLPIWGADIGSHTGVPLYHSATGGLQLWDPMPPTAENYISLTVGAQGSGKTFLTINQLRVLLTCGVPGFVLDTSEPESHYKPLCDLVGGAVLELGAGSNEHRLCPWDVDASHDQERMPQKIQFVVDLHSALLGGLDHIDEGLMLTGVETVYRWAAENPELRPCETLLHRALLARAEHEDEHDPESAARCRRLAAAIEPYIAGGQRAWLMDEPTTLPPGGALMTVFDLRHCPESLRSAMTMIVLDHIMDRARARRRELAERPAARYAWDGATWVHIDEAAGQMDQEASGRQLNFFGRKSRHLGLRLSLSTQRLEDFDTPWGRALLSSASEQYYLSQRPRDYSILEALAGLSAHEIDLIRTYVGMARGYESRFYWVYGERRGLAALRVGTGAYWAATSHPAERPLRERALRMADGDPWRALEIMPELRAAELEAA